jgi:hypothetical protein
MVLPVSNALAIAAIDNSEIDSKAHSGHVTANFIATSGTGVLA